MIKRGAKLSLQSVALERLTVYQYDVRFPGTLNSYIDLLMKHPECDPEPLHVVPHPEYAGLFRVANGHHRFLAALATGRKEVMCIVEERSSAEAEAEEERALKEREQEAWRRGYTVQRHDRKEKA